MLGKRSIRREMTILHPENKRLSLQKLTNIGVRCDFGFISVMNFFSSINAVVHGGLKITTYI